MLSLLTFHFSFFALKAQLITTFAGNGAYGYTGNGGLATAAELSHPVNIAFDKGGNLYVADRQNHVVRKINTSGIISTIAGNGVAGHSGDGGPATAAELSDDESVLIDSISNIYIADFVNCNIRKVNTAGVISTFAGSSSLVCGYSGDGGQATAAELNSPVFMTMDSLGNLFFGDDASVVRKVNTSGIISTVAGNGVQGYTGDGGTATAAELCTEQVAFDKYGNMLITDPCHEVIRKVNTSGIISTIAGIGQNGYSGDGGPATAAELFSPCGIIIDSYGIIYFADEINNVIREIDGSGTIYTVAGNNVQGYSGDGGPATAAEMYYVSDIALDASGNMFLADEFNNVIRKVTGFSSGINQPDASNFQFSVFPNPVNQKLNIRFKEQNTGLATFTIMDITGREIMSEELKMKNEKCSIDVSSLSAGMYFLNFKAKDINETRKFIKQ